MLNKPLYKTTIVIWSDYDPTDKVEIDDLAWEAMRGDAICTSSHTIAVEAENEIPQEALDFLLPPEQ